MSSTDVVDQLEEAVSPSKNVEEKIGVVSPKKRKISEEGEEAEIEPKKAHVEEAANTDSEAIGNDDGETEIPAVAESEVDSEVVEATTEKSEEDSTQVTVDSFRQKFITLYQNCGAECVDVALKLEDSIFQAAGCNAKCEEYLTTAFNALYSLKFVEGFSTMSIEDLSKADFVSSIPDEVKEKIEEQVKSELSDEPKDFDIESLKPAAE